VKTARILSSKTRPVARVKMAAAPPHRIGLSNTVSLNRILLYRRSSPHMRFLRLACNAVRNQGKG